MTMLKPNLNDLFCVVPKDKEWVNGPCRFKLSGLIDFNEWPERLADFPLLYDIETNKSPARNSQSLTNEVRLTEYHPKNEKHETLCLKVAIVQLNNEYGFWSFHPYSMRQAYFLFNQDVDVHFLASIYAFTAEEIIQGWAIREGLKEEFYYWLMEQGKPGYYFFHYTNHESPEFISKVGLNLLEINQEKNDGK